MKKIFINFWDLTKLLQINIGKLSLTIFILSILTPLNFSAAHKFVFKFERNENSEIIFYSEIQKNITIFEGKNEEYYLSVLYCLDSKQSKTCLNSIFTYKKENFIGFEVLNKLFNFDTSESLNGKIECNFNLLYFLSLTKDISELSEKINSNQLIILLFIFKSLKAIKNKNIFELLQRIFFNLINQRIDEPGSEIFNSEEINRFLTRYKIGFYFKKNLLSAFLKNLMVEHVFYDENLVWVKDTKEIFDPQQLNEHVLYKNLLINDFEIFDSFEMFIRNHFSLNIFQALLNGIGIESLIINNSRSNQIHRSFSSLLKNFVSGFKSLKFSNLTGSTETILRKLNEIPNLNLEFFSMRKSTADSNIFFSLLRKQRLKGLVLDNVTITSDTTEFFDYLTSNRTLEYIFFKDIEITFYWWISIVKKSTMARIILSFDSPFKVNKFIDQFTMSSYKNNILHLDIWFNFFKIPKEFFDFLWYFRCLKTLKIFGYKVDENIESRLYRAIENMNALKNLGIEYSDFSDEIYNYFFEKQGLSILHIKNSFSNQKALNISLFNANLLFTQIILENIDISLNTIFELFKLENLEVLELRLSKLSDNGSSESLNLKSRNIDSLSLNGIVLNSLNFIDIFNKLNCLKTLQLFECRKFPCYLANLGFGCNLTLKTLCYKNGVLHKEDLDRLKLLAVLEKLDFYKCEFIECSFGELGKDCRFLGSLKSLDLSNININIQDLKYLLNFKHLKNLGLFFNYLHLQGVKFNLGRLARIHFSLKNRNIKAKPKNLKRYLYENSIEEISEI
ncbi:hypothetical protein LUQ84_001046 [Hamiltosporidium tvaerminnensis]|nr:hypothetical protein LUQ84_001046 [Hamiltosporidium tvaerminnensis]